MITCPECGHEFAGGGGIKREGYNGGFSHHNSMIEKMFLAGHTLREIAGKVVEIERAAHSNLGAYRWNSEVNSGLIRYILRRLGHDVKSPEVVNNKQRNAEIARLRKSGLTLQKIGEKFGLSRDRIRTIVAKYERDRQRTGFELLGVRVQNVLLNMHVEPTPEAISKLRREDLLSQGNFGMQSLRELEEWLLGQGFRLGLGKVRKPHAAA